MRPKKKFCGSLVILALHVSSPSVLLGNPPKAPQTYCDPMGYTYGDYTNTSDMPVPQWFLSLYLGLEKTPQWVSPLASSTEPNAFSKTAFLLVTSLLRCAVTLGVWSQPVSSASAFLLAAEVEAKNVPIHKLKHLTVPLAPSLNSTAGTLESVLAQLETGGFQKQVEMLTQLIGSNVRVEVGEFSLKDLDTLLEDGFALVKTKKGEVAVIQSKVLTTPAKIKSIEEGASWESASMAKPTG